MNIREWFNLESDYEKTKADISIDRMLILCRDALSKYFSVQNSKNIKDMIQRAREEDNDCLDHTFLEWLVEKGIPRLHNIELRDLPNSDHFIAMIEYDEYVLKCEMDFTDPEEVRSCIISFVNSLPEYISSAREVSASLENDYSEGKEREENAYSLVEDYISDEEALMTSISGSAINAGPFFIGGIINECA
ncbi:hypothetical protein ABQ520_13635 [Bacillus velezensis]|uniref:hypothetical protein n=1 Tax=Bacillus velezensis TaxID=492670 RepID=UPI001F1E4A42|nr:hypothetical protein [Bacillus velezensis]